MASGWIFALIVCSLWVGGNTRCSPRPAAYCETCPPGWTWYGGHCYLFDKNGKEWADAERYCNSLDGNLASIQSADEYTFLRDLIFRTVGSHMKTWVGGNDAAKDGVWMWSDGAKFLFNSWGKGEPNNSGGVESCMEINFGGNDYVNDAKCSIYNAVLCVKDP